MVFFHRSDHWSCKYASHLWC